MSERFDIKIRLVIFGSGKVGKTSIISQFLNEKFPAKYKETVEDLHSRVYYVNGKKLSVDILDTAGDLSFPAMRRLSITTATAFVLVYSVTDLQSFSAVQQLFFEIKETKDNFEESPMIIVGNKIDLIGAKVVDPEDVEEFISSQSWAASFLETSAKTNHNIVEIFNKLLQQFRKPLVHDLSPLLRRRTSERVKGRRQNNDLKIDDDYRFGRSRSLYRKGSGKKSGWRKSGNCEYADDDCSIM